MTDGNADFTKLRTLIESGSARIGVIGLGYVGLPLALAFADKFTVTGFDKDHGKRSLLQKRKSYIDDVSDSSLKAKVGKSFGITSKERDLADCDVLIICVPTPLDERGKPDLGCVSHSAAIVERVVRKGMLVILESTSYPGTTHEFIGSAIRRAGFEPGKDVALVFSPERVDPGNRKFNLSNTPKIVGGVNRASSELAKSLYSTIVNADIIEVRDCATAEAVKIVENVFRGVNIALVNEMALIFERMGIDTWEVIRAASTKPFGFMAHYPGPGVGGHCIPLDPIYLSYKAKQYGFSPRFIELSREVNEMMKTHTVNLVMESLTSAKVDPLDATVGVMGLSYKKGISDTRESPAIEIIEELVKKVGRVIVHDPYSSHIETRAGAFDSVSRTSILGKSDCLVFVTDHDEFRRIPVKTIACKGVKAIVDTRDLFSRQAVESAGLVYRGLGK